jgi:hypothetical protein
MSPISSASCSSCGGSQFSVRSRESTAAKLSVTTAEGDQVTLSFKQDSRASFSAGAAYGPSGRAVGARAGMEQRTEVAVSVEGNISDEELEDITALIGELTQAGQTENAGAVKPGGSSSFDTLQSFEFSYRRRVETDMRASRFSMEA